MEKSADFSEKSRLLALERELVEYRHSLRMRELEFERETLDLHHNNILEQSRISHAEERRMIEFKAKMEAKR